MQPVNSDQKDLKSIYESGIDLREDIFANTRQNVKVQSLDSCISCLAGSIFYLCFPFTCCANITTVKPMHDTIVSEFGTVTQILREPGPYCTGFFGVNTSEVYMGLNTIEIKIQVAADSHGSPLVVSAQFVYHITNSLNANFKTANLTEFITEQASLALRKVLAGYPLNVNTSHDCLTKHSDKIENQLIKTFQDLIELVGVKVDSFRLINVEYKKSVEKLDLAKQEAKAVIAASEIIAEDSYEVIKTALKQFKHLGFQLDEYDKIKFATDLSLTLINRGQTTLNLVDGGVSD